MSAATTGIRGFCIAVAVSLVGACIFAQDLTRVDSQIERTLMHGRIVPRESLEGVTDPIKVEVAFEGQTSFAVFKSIDIDVRRGYTRFERGRPELNFSDSYRYERAAYLLDRQLGLQMVPAAVLRRVKGTHGVLIDWIDGACHPSAVDRAPSERQAAELARQQATMHLFDALILNTDRHAKSLLIRTEDWKLFLIDHSRAFRRTRELPEQFLARPARLSRALYRKLGELREPELRDLLRGVISRSQIRSLLARRDAILAKIDSDLEMYGEQVVFSR